MKKFISCMILSGLLSVSDGPAAKHKVREIVVRPAAEYAAHQGFQGLVVGVQPFRTEAEILEIFDVKKLHERRIMPMLVVIENENDFAVRIHQQEIFLVKPDGATVPSLGLNEVLLRISLKKPLSSYSTREDILLSQSVKRDLRDDFERKSFGEKLIAPHDSDYGVVFFDTPAELTDYKVFLPEIFNMRDEEKLIFFEFPLLAPPE